MSDGHGRPTKCREENSVGEKRFFWGGDRTGKKGEIS